MRQILASPDSFRHLMTGKYSRWAKHLDETTLEALLVAVLEFGGRYLAMRSGDEGFPTPVFHCPGVSRFRMANALRAFAVLVGTGKFDVKMPSGWPESFSAISPAFSRAYSDRLAGNKSTAWAANLDERSLAQLIWQVGEFGIRANTGRQVFGSEGPPLSFAHDEGDVRVMRAALGIIASVESGSVGSIDTATEIIARATNNEP